MKAQREESELNCLRNKAAEEAINCAITHGAYAAMIHTACIFSLVSESSLILISGSAVHVRSSFLLPSVCPLSAYHRKINAAADAAELMPSMEYAGFAARIIDFFVGLLFLFLVRRVAALPAVWKYLLTWVTVADLFMNLTFLADSIIQMKSEHILPDECKSSLLCVSVAFFSSWTACVTAIWNTVIGVYTFGISWRDWPPDRLSKVDRVFLQYFSWALPFFLNVLAAIFKAFGRDNTVTGNRWCLISSCPTHNSPFKRVFWMLVTQRIWEVSVFCTIMNLIIQFLFHYSRTTRRQSFNIFTLPESEASLDTAVRQDNARIEARITTAKNHKMYFWIPFLFVLIRIWGSIRFILSAQECYVRLTPALANLSARLLNIQAVLTHTQSILNLILLSIFHPEVRRFIKMRALGCCSRTAEAGNDQDGVPLNS